MNAKPLVSVIIIFLNEERFLKEAIESVLAQTYDHWDMLLVDDGSTDESPRIAHEFENQYPDQIQYLTHPDHANLGMSASRNLGVRRANGRYISYLDGDDVWLPNKLERQVAILDQHSEAVMVYGPLQLWYSWTGDLEDKDRDCLYGLDAPRITLHGNRLLKPPELLTLFIQHRQLIPAGIMIQREAILNAGGYEDRFRGNFEDAVLMAKVCLNAPVFISEECWYRYRQHPQSCTKLTRESGQSEAKELIFLDWIEDYLSHKNSTDRTIWSAVRSARRRLQHPGWYNFVGKCRVRLGWVRNKLLNRK